MPWMLAVNKETETGTKSRFHYLCLELISRAASSVGVLYRSLGPNTGSNPGGGQIPKKKKLGTRRPLPPELGKHSF